MHGTIRLFLLTALTTAPVSRAFVSPFGGGAGTNGDPSQRGSPTLALQVITPSADNEYHGENYYYKPMVSRMASGMVAVADHIAGKVVTTKTTTARTPTPTRKHRRVPGRASAVKSSSTTTTTTASKNVYVDFARTYPFLNNLLIATLKTGAADLLAQTVISGSPITKLDVPRSVLFMLFGAIYSGGFQWLYQVRIFQKLFDVNKFTNRSWSQKLRDRAGLQSLGAQTAHDLGVLTVAYLPAFYIFKAGVFSGSMDPIVWVRTGLTNYGTNVGEDWFDLLRVWLPADLICFSVPMYLRLPVRHVVSFAWTAYLSFARGGH